jgi:predicted nucleotidyltransferase
MISPHDRSLAEALKNLLTAKTSLVDFRVFGSRARGDAADDSDMDIFIEVETLDCPTKRMISDIVWDFSIDNGVVISPLFFSRSEMEDTPMRSSSIVESIMEEGVQI